MTDCLMKTTLGVCETQPVTVEGLKSLLRSCPDLEFSAAANSLHGGLDMIRNRRPDVVLADKAFGVHALLEWIADVRAMSAAPVLAIWGISITEAEALRFLQAGARGVIRKGAEPEVVLACLRAVAVGMTWMEDAIFRDSPASTRNSHSELTPRELQVLELVEQGLKNTEIARELGIRPGTVKIHLKHIFEKTGIRGRYGLALSSLRGKRALSMQRA